MSCISDVEPKDHTPKHKTCFPKETLWFFPQECKLFPFNFPTLFFCFYLFSALFQSAPFLLCSDMDLWNVWSFFTLPAFPISPVLWRINPLFWVPNVIKFHSLSLHRMYYFQTLFLGSSWLKKTFRIDKADGLWRQKWYFFPIPETGKSARLSSHGEMRQF